MPSGQQQDGEREFDDGLSGAGLSGSGPHDAWEACPAGELTQMVQRLQARQRRARSKQVVATALVSAGLFALVVIAVGSLMGPPSSHYGGISCSYCRHHFAEYQPYLASEGAPIAAADAGTSVGTSTETSAETSAGDPAFLMSMRTHLEKCTFCRERFNALYPDQRLTRRASAWPRMWFAKQAMFACSPTVACDEI